MGCHRGVPAARLFCSDPSDPLLCRCLAAGMGPARRLQRRSVRLCRRHSRLPRAGALGRHHRRRLRRHRVRAHVHGLPQAQDRRPAECRADARLRWHHRPHHGGWDIRYSPGDALCGRKEASCLHSQRGRYWVITLVVLILTRSPTSPPPRSASWPSRSTSTRSTPAHTPLPSGRPTTTRTPPPSTTGASHTRMKLRTTRRAASTMVPAAACWPARCEGKGESAADAQDFALPEW